MAMTGRGSRQAGATNTQPSRSSSPRRRPPLGADSFPVVGFGASAGGLDAFRRLLAVLPAGTGMAFILIQHLDPTHASMMVDLLAGYTPLTVQHAADGMPLARIIHEALEAAVLQRDRRAVFRGVGDAVVGV
jgi:two-component system, chemotaxis family, CheB/CheR fusion protein